MFDRKFQRISTNGIELNTVVEGEGPLVVLLHGFPQCAFLWRHQIDPIIEAGFRVAVPDQRGYGSSDAPEAVSAYNIRELANDAAGTGRGSNPQARCRSPARTKSRPLVSCGATSSPWARSPSSVSPPGRGVTESSRKGTCPSERPRAT